MKRIAAVVGATLIISLASTGAARADNDAPPMVGCGGGYIGDALSTHLSYRFVHWSLGSDPDGSNLGIDAPRSWKFVRTPQGEGRFHDSSGNDVLSLRAAEGGDPAALMAAQVKQLAGTSGLKIIGQHVKMVGDQTWATLAYRWTSMGEPRLVKERWIAYGTGADADTAMVLTVAGRPLDGHGIDALLAHVTPTAVIAG